MAADPHKVPVGARGWRRKWTRAPSRQRRQAAGSLGDLFAGPRRRGGGVLLLLVLAAAAAHAALAPLAYAPGTRGEVELTVRDAYMRKVVQTERARHVAKGLAERITMPPPPPVPESAVQETLSESLATDVKRVIGEGMDVKITAELAREVTGSLREELAAAARDIAQGKLSAREIADLQEQFTRKAHRRTVQALRQHREKTQVVRAKLSVKEWYQSEVSKTLMGRMKSLLFGAHGGMWGQGWNKMGHWGYLQGRWFAEKSGQLSNLAAARHYDPHNRIGGRPTGGHARLLPDWPKPTPRQAAAMLTIMGHIHDGWDDAVAGYVDAHHPHRREQVAGRVARVGELWDRLWDQAEKYQQLAQAGKPADDLLAARGGCFETLKALRDECEALAVPSERVRQCRTVNQAAMSRVLRGPACERMYKRFVDNLVEGLSGPMRDLAAGEFGEGILIRRKGVDGIAREFAEEVLALLRADIMKVVPRGRWGAMVFESHYANPYRSPVNGERCPPGPEHIRRDEAAFEKITGAWPEAMAGYPRQRAAVIEREFARQVDRITGALLDHFVSEGRLRRDFYRAVESVDYTDKVQQRLRARARALAGRGQDMARLTDEGVPDSSAMMVALLMGAARDGGAPLQPVAAGMVPAYASPPRPSGALRSAAPRLPPAPASWGRVTQPDVDAPFDCIRCEGIPFLANFPRLDGDLTDWGRIRPLVTQKVAGRFGPDEDILLYAAWNYQGFFFGYHVTLPSYQYAWPGLAPGQYLWRYYRETTGVIPRRAPTYRWAYTGDYLRLLFDTVDARSEWRGEPYTQEFLILPRGTEMHPNIPGIERRISSMRDCRRRAGGWGMVKAVNVIFPPQPAPHEGPDGTGPYRVTRFTKDGYTVEVFIPRTLFNVPVFSPGWWIGFECVVGVARQTRRPHARIWASPHWHPREEMGGKDHPNTWGDLLLLGTDPRLAVQDADAGASLSTGIVPGHSYLLTVIDPDRNIHLTGRDTVVVSAEVLDAGGAGSSAAGGPPGGGNDMEVFVLTETDKNTSVFRGYVNTQPGTGREVQGVVEALPGQNVRFGYVDLANAAGTRNVIYYHRLPVLAGMGRAIAARP